ncbi:MAG: hypothetical protein M3Y34_08255 [Actinomycetota bacterium]|nr:hypothetical protein [Actinomycetota bacterium]
MDLIEDIGPILGIVAFLGFAILALMIVLQAREVRRLREWAGRAPERAVEADDAAQAASEKKGDADEADRPSRLGSLRARVSSAVGPRWDQLDRRSPVDPRILLVLLIGVIVAAIVTSGFGLLSDDSAPVAATEDGGGTEKVEVAVLNATVQEGVAEPVPGIADLIADDVVKSSEFEPGVTANAPAGEEDSVIMFEPDSEADAEALAEVVRGDLGETEIEPMSQDVRGEVKGAPLALLVGFDDRALGEEAAAQAP